MKRRIQVLGRSWSLNFVALKDKWGDCSDPALPRRTIRISSAADDKQTLDAVVHEMLHAAGWHIDEGFVEQFAHDVAAVLCDQLGYTRRDDG